MAILSAVFLKKMAQERIGINFSQVLGQGATYMKQVIKEILLLCKYQSWYVVDLKHEIFSF